MPAIEVFADVCCPFTHVGLRRVVDARHQRGAEAALLVRSWPLELVNGEPLDGDLIATEVAALRQQAAPDLFAGFDRSAFPASSIPAMALTAGAYRQGPQIGEQMALAVRWALFEEGRDVADPAVLADLARSVGVALADAEDEAQVAADWEDGKDRGVIGSPHFLVAGEGFFCPGLDIRHADGAFAIRPDVAGFTRFLELALGSPG